MSELGEYQNFDLQIEKAGKGFKVSVPGLSGTRRVSRLPYKEAELAAILARLSAPPDRDLRAREAAPESVQQVGRTLFDALFPDEVRSRWRESLARAEENGQGLRLRLRLHSPALEAWPWELMFDPDRRRFLGQSPATPIVRYVSRSTAPLPPPAAPPLRMLVVLAQPAGCSLLDGEKEWNRLRQGLRDWIGRGWLILERLESASLEELRKRLQEPLHVLHVVTHGQEGALILEDEAGRAQRVTGVRLGEILAAQRELRLVVLNACDGAVPAVGDPSGGLAQALVGAGIPAVLAMRSRIKDDAAIRLAESFYESLSRSLPFDAALAAARHALYSRQDDLEWAAPVLYTRSPDCRLFRFPPSPTSAWMRTRTAFGRVPKYVWGAATLAAMGALLPLLRTVPINSLSPAADPNLEYAAKNPPDCPSPPELPVAFVKIEPAPPLRPFCLGRFEVTQGLWRKVVGKLPTRLKGEAYPVTKVSREETELFLAGLRSREPGGVFRLPTGAEWESAAASGEDPRSAPVGAANCSNQQGDDGFRRAAPVSSYPPNHAGLFDMLGNVSEWVSDEEGGKVIRRGGGFNNVLENCAVDYVSRVSPDSRPEDAGFRIVRELKR